MEKYAYLATLEQIRENDFNLNIPRYVDTFEEEPIDIEAVQQEIDDLEHDLTEIKGRINGYLEEFRYSS